MARKRKAPPRPRRVHVSLRIDPSAIDYSALVAQRESERLGFVVTASAVQRMWMGMGMMSYVAGGRPDNIVDVLHS
jgi:hypothetical protein